jgi:hypothetical protein
MTSRPTFQDLCYQKVPGSIRNVTSNTKNERTLQIPQYNCSLTPEDWSRRANCGGVVYAGYRCLSPTQYSYNELTITMNSASEKFWRSLAASFAIYHLGLPDCTAPIGVVHGFVMRQAIRQLNIETCRNPNAWSSQLWRARGTCEHWKEH